MSDIEVPEKRKKDKKDKKKKKKEKEKPVKRQVISDLSPLSDEEPVVKK